MRSGGPGRTGSGTARSRRRRPAAKPCRSGMGRSVSACSRKRPGCGRRSRGPRRGAGLPAEKPQRRRSSGAAGRRRPRTCRAVRLPSASSPKKTSPNTSPLPATRQVHAGSSEPEGRTPRQPSARARRRSRWMAAMRAPMSVAHSDPPQGSRGRGRSVSSRIAGSGAGTEPVPWDTAPPRHGAKPFRFETAFFQRRSTPKAADETGSNQTQTEWENGTRTPFQQVKRTRTGSRYTKKLGKWRDGLRAGGFGEGREKRGPFFRGVFPPFPNTFSS